MGLGKYAFTLFGLFSLGKGLLPSESKQYRTDYEYNRKTDAFYKLHTESRYGLHVNDYCEIEGAKLMTPSYQDLVQAHTMFKRYPDLGAFLWIGSDGISHESAEEQPLIDLTPNEYDDTSDFNDNNCDVMKSDGEVKTMSCHNSLPFICKVSSKNIPYDSHCDVYATGYNYYPEVGSCYKIPDMVFAWNEAYAECQAEGAHLAVINSKAEHLVIKNLTNSAKPALQSRHSWYFLIGFRAISPSRVFRTVFNQTLEEAGYSEWSYTEPNNLNNSEYCGSVLKEDGKLNDVNCIDKYAFICEKEVHT